MADICYRWISLLLLFFPKCKLFRNSNTTTCSEVVKYNTSFSDSGLLFYGSILNSNISQFSILYLYFHNVHIQNWPCNLVVLHRRHWPGWTHIETYWGLWVCKVFQFMIKTKYSQEPHTVFANPDTALWLSPDLGSAFQIPAVLLKSMCTAGPACKLLFIPSTVGGFKFDHFPCLHNTVTFLLLWN